MVKQNVIKNVIEYFVFDQQESRVRWEEGYESQTWDGETASWKTKGCTTSA